MAVEFADYVQGMGVAGTPNGGVVSVQDARGKPTFLDFSFVHAGAAGVFQTDVILAAPGAGQEYIIAACMVNKLYNQVATVIEWELRTSIVLRPIRGTISGQDGAQSILLPTPVAWGDNQQVRLTWRTSVAAGTNVIGSLHYWQRAV